MAESTRGTDREPDGGDGAHAEPAGARPATADEIRETYEEQASTMDRFAVFDRLVLGRYRRRLFGRAEGRALDAACGLGTNRRYLPAPASYVGVDLSPEMLRRAAARNPDLELGEDLREMDAEALEFPDDSFDTVISSLSTCTFPDPYAALAEMGRVCAPGGQVLLLEHGRSSVGPIARFQDWRAESHYEKHACRLNQVPLEVVARSALSVREHWTALAGILTGIVAEPPE